LRINVFTIDGISRLARRMALVFAALLVLPVPGTAQAAGEGSVSLAYGTVGPGAEVEDLDGNKVDLIDYVKGKPALLEFWATWCELCEALQPQMDRIQIEYGDRLNVVAVAVGVSQSVRRVKRHIEGHDPGYPYLWDGRGAAVRAYNATTTSIVVMLDADGKVAYTGVGSEQDLVGAVERLLGS
jgi:thiol-disulfide isomerase/thioredoxin